MQARSLLPIAALLIAVGVGLWWNANREAAPNNSGLNSPGLTASSSPDTVEDSPVLVEAEVVSAPEEAQRTTVTNTPKPTPNAVDLEATPKQAIWIDGFVELPDGTPADEEIWVEARGKKFPDDKNGRRKHKVKVSRDGKFRVGVAPDTKTASLNMQGAFCSLPDAFVWKAGETDEVVLRPVLGGIYEVTLTYPPGTEMPPPEWKAKLTGYNYAWIGPIDFPEDGRISIRGLAQRSYVSLEIRADGLAPVSERMRPPTAGERTPLSIEMHPASSLKGSVKDSKGHAITSGELHFDPIDDGRMIHYIGPRGGGTPIEEGQYQSEELAAGDYQITYSGKGYLANRIEVKGLGIGEDRTFHITLEEGRSIAGTVVWDSGEPAAGATIRLLTAGDPRYDSDKDGTHELIKADAEGKFYMSGFADATPVSLAVSGIRPGLSPPEGLSKIKRRRWDRENTTKARSDKVIPGGPPLTIRLGDSGDSLAGQVVDETGNPIKRFRVIVAPRLGNTEEVAEGGWIRKRFKGEDGKFLLPNVPPGKYGITATATGHLEGKPTWVTVPTGKDLKLVLTRAGSISGTVVNSRDELVEANVTLKKANDEGGISNTWSRRDQQVSSANNGFKLKGLEPGVWHIWAEKMGFGRSEAMTVKVGPGEQVEDIKISIPSPGSLAGTVHADWLRNGPVGVELHLKSSESQRLSFYQGAQVGDDGKFEFTTIPAGEYQAALVQGKARMNTDNGINSMMLSVASDSGSLDLGIEKTITVPSDRASELHFGGRAASSIVLSGTVLVGKSPQALWHLQFHQTDVEGKPKSIESKTDENGAYRAILPGTGRYRVSFKDAKKKSRSTGQYVQLEIPGEVRHDFELPSGGVTLRLNIPRGEKIKRASNANHFMLRPTNGPGSLSANLVEGSEVYFSNVSPGKYSLVNKSVSTKTTTYVVSGPKEIEYLGTDENQIVPVQLELAATIEGTITGIPDGQDWITVFAFRSNEGRESLGYAHGRGGSFTLTGMPKGDVWVSTVWGEGPDTIRTKVSCSYGATATTQIPFQSQ